MTKKTQCSTCGNWYMEVYCVACAQTEQVLSYSAPSYRYRLLHNLRAMIDNHFAEMKAVEGETKTLALSLELALGAVNLLEELLPAQKSKARERTKSQRQTEEIRQTLERVQGYLKGTGMVISMKVDDIALFHTKGGGPLEGDAEAVAEILFEVGEEENDALQL